MRIIFSECLDFQGAKPEDKIRIDLKIIVFDEAKSITPAFRHVMVHSVMCRT